MLLLIIWILVLTSSIFMRLNLLWILFYIHLITINASIYIIITIISVWLLHLWIAIKIYSQNSAAIVILIVIYNCGTTNIYIIDVVRIHIANIYLLIALRTASASKYRKIFKFVLQFLLNFLLLCYLIII